MERPKSKRISTLPSPQHEHACRTIRVLDPQLKCRPISRRSATRLCRRQLNTRARKGESTRTDERSNRGCQRGRAATWPNMGSNRVLKAAVEKALAPVLVQRRAHNEQPMQICIQPHTICMLIAIAHLPRRSSRRQHRLRWARRRHLLPPRPSHPCSASSHRLPFSRSHAPAAPCGAAL